MTMTATVTAPNKKFNEQHNSCYRWMSCVVFSACCREITYDIHPRYGEILERNETYYKRRIFLESLHSNIDKNSVNERMEFPRAYVPLLRSLGNQNIKQ